MTFEAWLYEERIKEGASVADAINERDWLRHIFRKAGIEND